MIKEYFCGNNECCIRRKVFFTGIIEISIKKDAGGGNNVI